MDLTRVYYESELERERQLSTQKRPTVLVAGFVGAGKTSLIQAICGKGIVPDDRVGAGLPKTQAFDFYEDHLIRFFDSKGLEPGTSETPFIDEAKRFVRSLQDDRNVDNHVHLVWYTIQGPGARVTPCDLRLIQEIFPNVIVLITKNDITRPDQRQAMTDVLTQHGVRRDRILPCSEIQKDSLKAIVELSYKLLPEAYRDAFVAAQSIDIEKKRSKGRDIVFLAASRSALVCQRGGGQDTDDSFIGIIGEMMRGLETLYNQPSAVLRDYFSSPFIEALNALMAANRKAWLRGTRAKNTYAWTEVMGCTAETYLFKHYEARLADEIPPEGFFDLRAFQDAYARQREKLRFGRMMRLQ